MSRMSRIPRIAFVIGLALAVAAPLLAASSSSKPTTAEPAPQVMTPQDQAIEHYNQGIALRDRAKKLHGKLGETSEGPKRDKTLRNIESAWQGAIAEFTEATKLNEGMFQAYSELGFALRTTGQYDPALEAYDRALALEPTYTQAIEYRAEAYLGLDRIDDAKQSYESLLPLDRGHAIELLDAMGRWVEKRKTAPGAVDARTVSEFERWIEQRRTEAGDVVGHAIPQNGKSWQ